MKRSVHLLSMTVLSILLAPGAAHAVDVVGGQTNVALDTATLSSAAGLDLSSVSPDVISPGTLSGSVAFAINARNAPVNPTSFSYDPADFFDTFTGTIGHEGSVFFNSDTVEVGDFVIAFDEDRTGTLSGTASGLYVESTTGVTAILFDVQNPSSVLVSPTSLGIEANLLVSPEFAAFLGDAGLAGADVGDTLVEANAIPEPASAALLLLCIGALARRGR